MFKELIFNIILKKYTKLPYLKKTPTILLEKLQLKQTTKFRNVQTPLKA
jgi:hypothetical protein